MVRCSFFQRIGCALGVFVFCVACCAPKNNEPPNWPAQRENPRLSMSGNDAGNPTDLETHVVSPGETSSKLPEVAFLGPKGTFAHIAAPHFFKEGEARFREKASIEEVFEAVRHNTAPYGVVPIENSTAGMVTPTVDGLLKGGVLIRKELVLPVRHCLVSFAYEPRAIKRVYSHPQALAQCSGWLSEHLPDAQLVQTSSTAEAVRKVITDPQGAAISSELAAKMYKVPVLYKNLQDRPDNATRFVLLAKQDGPRTGEDKTTLSFSLRDMPGALKQALDIFSTHVKLLRIKSFPTREKPREAIYLVEFEGHREDDLVAQMLEKLRAPCVSVTLHGSYPRYRPMRENSFLLRPKL